ncbi:hypothetical protein [Kineococcus sp. SYSU DK006]|uniref:hypothetical protein n=1 Tax=Kineococcus sp. SYSU DK006 TaxID=3383127 RepID=UPI003D7DA4EE
MRLVLVLPLAALSLLLGSCGTEAATSSPSASASSTSEPTTAPGEGEGGWTSSPEEIARQEWLQGGPMATSMPTRTCTYHQPTGDELASTDPDDPDAISRLYWMSCFDPDAYQTVSACTAPPDLPADGTYICVEKPNLTQRVVDDWNQYAEAEDRASAEQLGLSLEEYREQYPDQHADGSPVVAVP